MATCKLFSAFPAKMLLLTTTLYFVGCKDEYSFEGRASDSPTTDTALVNAGNARFVMIGEPDSCGGAVIAGAFEAGVALTTENVARLAVNVTTIGQYQISTDTINGIFFSGIGSFDSIGKQIVLLKGKGTPVNPGTLYVSAKAPGTHCPFKLEILGAGLPATYILIADPTTHCVNTSVNGNYRVGVPLTAENTVTIVVDVKVPGSFNISTDTINGTTFSNKGKLAKTGYQYVVLTATGIPVTTGSYAFKPQIIGPHPLGNDACTFFVLVQ